MNSIEKNTTSRKGLLSRVWVRVMAGLVILLLLLLVLTPYIIAWSARGWLLENGADQVELEDIDFNPFTGVVLVEHLSVREDGRDVLDIPRLMLDIDWGPLFSRNVRVHSATIDGVHLTVDVSPDGALGIAGVTLAESDTGEDDTGEDDSGEPWGYGIDELNISNTVIDYRAPDLQLETEIHDLALSGLTTWATAPAPLAFDGALNGAGISLDGRLPALSDGYGYAGSLAVSGLSLQAFAGLVQPAVSELSGRLTLDSRIDVGYMDGDPVRAKQDGLIRLEDLQVVQAENNLAYKRLEWQGTTTFVMDDVVDVNISGTLSGDALDLALPDQNLGLRQLVWEGTAGVNTADDVAVNSSGKLDGSGIEFVMPSEEFRLLQEGLSWEGSAGYTGGEAGDLQVSGRLKLDMAEVDAVEEATRLLGFDALTIDSIDIQGIDAITIENLVIAGAALADAGAEAEAADAVKGAEKVPPLQIASLSFDRIEVSDGKRVSIDTIESREAQYTALRNKGGKWRMATIMESLPFMGAEEEGESGGGKEGEPGDGEAEPGSVRVGVLRNTDFVLRFEDYSVTPPFRLKLSGTEVTKDIDTAKPNQDTHVYLNGKTASHDTIEVKGTVRPLASPVSMNLETHIEGLEMPPLSPYAITSIGHRLDSGQLDADSTLKVDQGQLDGVNKLVMRGLSISPVKGGEQEKTGTPLVPLDKGLDMLRDDHDVITLELPITGALDSPDFDISDVLNQAIAKATKEGAIASLTLLLQPYGSLITVARYAADKASAVHLDPVEFAPASAEVDEARHDYLDKVAGIITKRPAINVMLCGVAAASDRAALAEQAAKSQAAGSDKKQAKEVPPVVEVPDERLIRLADERDAAIKDYLVGKHGVKPGRLVACQPSIDNDEGAVPRVDLLI